MYHQPRIILAEDNGLIRSLLARLFIARIPTALVHLAQHGADALALYRQHGADLILSDCEMPVMDGLALAAVLRAEGAALPIVLMSAGDDYTEASRAAGATAFLEKHDALTEIVTDVQRRLGL